MVQEIFIIDDNEDSIKILKYLFRNDIGYKFRNIKTNDLDIALRNIPSLIIINDDALDCNIIDLCKKIRLNEDNSITPIIVASSNTDKEYRIRVLESAVEYYIKKPLDEQYLYYTIKNIIRLMYTNRRVSPLTGLPGNVQIQAEIKKRWFGRNDFAVLYFDLDNFKAYNDVYGFLKGDEIIKLTSRIIFENLHINEEVDCFVGHIGGDDFVALLSGEDYEKICQNIIIDFDKKILEFYNEQDKQRGYIEVSNRKGILEQYPLTSISIGVVEVDSGRFNNTLEIGEVGAQVKHTAKSIMGSTYVIDKRKK